MSAKDLVLQKLQHGRIQSFRHAVYLIQKQYAFLKATLFHGIVYGGNDLAHRIFRYRHFPAAVELLFDKGKSQR